MYESAQQLPVDVIDGTSTGFNIFEQGAGRIPSIDILHTNLNKLLEQPPVPSFYPQKLDLTDCPYMWPWCAQPIYYSAQPLVINVTVLNPISAWGKFCEQPTYEPEINGKAIELDLSDYTSIRPYSGHLGVRIKVSSKYRLWEGVASGRIIARVCTPTSEPVSVELPVQVNVIRTPVRRKRILWSQYHNVQYPMGYIPRDNLNHKDNILDWNGDHPHTNFRTIFQHLIKSKYYVELLVGDLTSFDARMYGTLLLVDTEEEFTQEERNKLQDDVERLGLGLAVFGDWYNTDIMQEIRFFDDNTKTTWYPLTGGCNIPALNALLDPYHIAFGDHIYDGEITAILKKQDQEEQRSVIRATYGSGTSLVKFPQGGIMVRFPLKDQTKEMLKQANETPDVPVLGFVKHEKGRIAVFGDSNCLDDVNRPVYCTWLLDQMLRFTSFDAVPTNDRGIVYAKFEYVMNEDFVQPGVKLPERVPGRVVSPRVPLQNLIHARPLQNLTRYIGKGLKTEPYDSSGEVVADNSVVQLSLSPLRLLIPIGLMFIVPASVLYFIFRKRVHKFTRESRLRV
jgi:membrane-bound transcription factor site-1 protease